MKKWDVYGKVVGSKYLGQFEAESAEKAIDLAGDELSHISLCWSCSDLIEDDLEIIDPIAVEVPE